MSENEDLICTARNRPYMVAYEEGERKAIIFQPRCKQWSCPACAKINKSLWALRTNYGVETLIEQGHEIFFTTLTTHERLSAETALVVWPKQWGKLAQRARRAADVFEYLLVPERHETGKIHVHLLDTAGLPTRWWKDNGRESGLGYMNESGEVKSGAAAARYTTKYLSKQLEYQAWPKGFRRVRTSQKWPRLPEMPESIFIFRPVQDGRALGDVVAGLLNAGYEVALANHREAWQLVQNIDRTSPIDIQSF